MAREGPYSCTTSNSNNSNYYYYFGLEIGISSAIVEAVTSLKLATFLLYEAEKKDTSFPTYCKTSRESDFSFLEISHKMSAAYLGFWASEI